MIMDDSGRIREGVYFKPVQTNFATMDSLLLLGDTLHFFQMTVSREGKTVSSDGLTTLYNRLGVTDRRYKHLQFYFVVPPDAFKSFTLSRGKGSWPPDSSTQSDAARTSLCVMEGYVLK